MKGWKETYTNIVLDEKLGRKTVRLVKDLEKAIDKTGDLIKQLPEEMEDSDSYQELSQGQNALEYGIRFLEDDLESLDSLSGVDEEVVKENTTLASDTDYKVVELKNGMIRLEFVNIRDGDILMKKNDFKKLQQFFKNNIGKLKV